MIVTEEIMTGIMMRDGSCEKKIVDVVKVLLIHTVL